jgi:hypothetical protein
METLTPKPKVKTTNFKVVIIDESRDWKEDTLKACGGKIETVYFYDANIVTHLCELTPSYYLIPLYCVPETPFNDLDGITMNNLDEGENSCEPIYVHCHQVDGMKHAKEKLTELNGRYTKRDGKKYRQLEDDCHEWLRGNSPY